MLKGIRTGASVLATLMLASLFTSISQGGEAARKRFEREYPAAAERTEHVFSQLQGNCRRRLVINGVDSPKFAVEGRFALEGENVTATFFEEDEDGKKTTKGANVYCASSNTYFHVYRMPGASNFRLESIGASKDAESMFNNVFGGFVGVSFRLRGRTIRKLMDSSDFEWVDVSEITRNGKPLVNVHFITSYGTGDSDMKENVSLDLDPAMNWAVRAVEIHPVKNPHVKITYQAEYGIARDGVPLPRLVRYQCVPIQTQIMEFDSYSFEPTPTDKFTLAGYGLADSPSDAPVTRNDWTLYRLVGLAAFGLVVSFGLKRLADRTRKVSST